MNQRIKSVIIFLPKLIIFVLTIFNFFYIHSNISYPLTNGTTVTFYESYYWFERSTADLWILLTASICLLVSKQGSYIMGIILSGYIFVYGLILFNRRTITLLEVWNYTQKNELNIFLEWEVQFLLAGIILFTTIFYIFREELLKRAG